MVAEIPAKRDFLFSIRPAYADMIFDGVKTVELRRRFSEDVVAGTIIYIYSTSPTQAVIGKACISGVQRLKIRTLWNQFGKAACITKQAFDAYFIGVSEGYAILLEDIQLFERAVTAAKLKKHFGFVAPQSFMYLRQEYYKLLNNEQFQITN